MLTESSLLLLKHHHCDKKNSQLPLLPRIERQTCPLYLWLGLRAHAPPKLEEALLSIAATSPTTTRRAESIGNKELYVHPISCPIRRYTIKAEEKVRGPFFNTDTPIKTGLTTSPSTKLRFAARPRRQSYTKHKDVGDV